MAFTRLSPTGTPGRPYSFSAKATGPHTGLFTELSVIGIPGRRHSFISKAALYPKRHGGPGGSPPLGGWHQWSQFDIDAQMFTDELGPMQLKRIRQDDEEILEILIQTIFPDLI